MSDIIFHLGTAETKRYEVSFNAGGHSYVTYIDVQYDGDGNVAVAGKTSSSFGSKTVAQSAFVLNSTKVIIVGGYYIDTDLGEAYKLEGGQYISLNRYIDLGSDLPVLAPGANTVTFDNTITDLQVIPRWWKI